MDTISHVENLKLPYIGAGKMRMMHTQQEKLQ